VVASSLPLAGCDQSSSSATPTDPSRVVATGALAAKASGKVSPQETAVRAAMEDYKQFILDSNVDELDRLWADDYTFINPQGAIATKAQRLANFSSGNTDVAIIDSEREITVRISGDMAVVQNLSTLHGQFNGVPTDTDLRGTFVWVRRGGRWQLLTNQLTAVGR
jgi:ketosteroid isomerase-like protein